MTEDKINQPETLTFEAVLYYEIVSYWAWWLPPSWTAKYCLKKARRKWDRMHEHIELAKQYEQQFNEKKK